VRCVCYFALIPRHKSMKKTSLSLIVVVVLAHTAHAATYYVSKSGSDSNAGTSTNLSFLTIQNAASVMNAGDICYILSGTYRETVTPAHSGTSGSPITFAAYPGAIPVVSGAEVLNLPWSVYSNSIYQASTAKSFRQLFVDGVMMNEARWPNATVDNLLYAPRSTPGICSNTYLVDASLPNVNLLGATLHIFPNEYANQGYAANTRQITGWDSSTKAISWVGNIFDSGAVGTLYYVYGALSLLDIPTEWYLNTASSTFYLWTPDGASPATHVIEIKARTSAFTLDNRSYVIVSGLYVFGAGISMANTINCVVDKCNLRYVQHNTTADWTVNVPIANQVSGSGSIWKNSTISFSSQDGIRCTGQNEVVSNCVIQQVDYYPGTYYAGVTAFSGGIGTKIINNTLWYSGRYCVGASAPSVEIAYNDLGWGDLLTSDGGAEYVYVAGGNGGGTTIHHNWAHHSWAGIYIDGLQKNYVVYRNVCWSNYVGMMFNQFANNQIYNNTSVSNAAHDIEFNGLGDTNVKLINNVWNTSRNFYSASTTVADNGWFPPLDTNYVPQAGSGAIDAGTLLPPYTDGYIGAAPDIGAYEVGGEYWIPGANFTPQPFPNSYALPSIVTQPTNQANYAGQTITFTMVAAGAPPLYYQWRGGVHGSGVYNNLVGGGQFSGVTNAIMTISNLVSSNAADYVVVITNTNGSVTSAVAVLTVLASDVAITAQPASQTDIVGQTATFTVTAAGLPPLYYQWRAGATGGGTYTNLIAGGQFSAVTNATVTISNLVLGNAADYVVVVTNSYGSITSTVATLTVLTNSSYQATILADHPVSYWPLNETSGTFIHDVVGTNNGTCINTNGLALGGPGILYGQDVTTDKAIYFTNTSSGYIKVPYSSTLNTPQFTVEVWLNLPTFPATGAGVDMNPLTFDDSNPKGWAFEIPSPNASNPKMYGWLGHGTWTQVNSGTCIQGQWSYYALAYDGTIFTVYTNGVSAGSQSSSYTQVSSLRTLYMGAYDSGGTVTRFYRGGMENVAFYSNALSSSQILNHYQVGSTGVPATPPIMWIQQSGSNVVVSWTSGFLQKAISVTGPWTDVTNAVSPYTVGATNPALFFRSKL
jgi:Concanavalin A-like lectin/glucanases superfamily/Immunoglobulin I-set domain